MNELLSTELMSALQGDAGRFAPELVLCGSIVLLLLIRLIPRYDGVHMGWLALPLAALTCYLSCQQWYAAVYLPSIGDIGAEVVRSEPLFGGMLVYDNFGIFLKIFLTSFLTLLVILTLLTGIPDKEDSADFYALLFGSTIGMSIMASSNHLLMVFVGIEMASLPSYALAGFLKGRRQSSEAALKYVVYGGGASGVMLYGISFIAGHKDVATGSIPVIVAQLSQANTLNDPMILMGILFVLVGLGFKLAAVPFHFWCPDVFEGASAEVGAFLSVASKGAALALLARIALGLGALTGTVDNFAGWSRMTDYLVPVLAVFAVVTTTFGNLAAYGQTNLKRLLAYSTIAHAGFMMMGLATMTRDGAGAVLFYLITYLFMNLGAFAVVAFMRDITKQEDLSYYRGFVFRSPLLVIMLGVFLLSLLGLPPLAGFAAKFQIFQVLYDSSRHYAEQGKPVLSMTMWVMLVAGGLNTVLSLFYYVKVLKVMVLEKTLEEVENRPVEQKPAPLLQASYATFLAIVILVLGVFWNPLSDASSADKGVNHFRAAPTRPAAANAPVVADIAKKGAN